MTIKHGQGTTLANVTEPTNGSEYSVRRLSGLLFAAKLVSPELTSICIVDFEFLFNGSWYPVPLISGGTARATLTFANSYSFIMTDNYGFDIIRGRAHTITDPVTVYAEIKGLRAF